MKRIIYLLIMVLCFSCEDKEFEVPQAQPLVIPSGDVISIRALISGLERLESKSKITFNKGNQFVEGYVISSDQEGNFFKELVLQDLPENPRAGVILQLDERAMYQRYPLGSKIRIRLKGLSVGFENGVAQLGILKENEIDPIDFSSIGNHVFRTGEVEVLKPLKLSVEQITRQHELLYISLDNLQFEKSLLEPELKTIAGEATDSFDGLRVMKHCPSGVEMILCTSTFSSFKSVDLPKGSGELTGVLTRDFGDDFFVMKINSINNLNFENETRCEPIFLDCPNIDVAATALLFEEDFETITNENKLEPLGWFNINVTGDEKRWSDKKVTNVDNRTLTISAFNSNLRPLEAWLITPEVDLNNVVDAYLKFRVRTRFNTGKTLNIWITNSYSGNPLTTNWELLPVEIPVKSSNFKTITQNISCVAGVVRVAFQYKGFDPVVTSTYEIDDVQFFGIKP